ncbi:hypothetical protein Cgig2_009674 [Carnegiea gigantea]|uniref:Uncharacterized protein n=1 Tax=Carnegiea gigantea TaxID=171969 RepID=A0A9Q1JNI4_9CARY|nr:hypothetical protein Cgig2_009674 [Carnegiea gigantea]
MSYLYATMYITLENLQNMARPKRITSAPGGVSRKDNVNEYEMQRKDNVNEYERQWELNIQQTIENFRNLEYKGRCKHQEEPKEVSNYMVSKIVRKTMSIIRQTMKECKQNTIIQVTPLSCISFAQICQFRPPCPNCSQTSLPVRPRNSEETIPTVLKSGHQALHTSGKSAYETARSPDGCPVAVGCPIPLAWPAYLTCRRPSSDTNTPPSLLAQMAEQSAIAQRCGFKSHIG